MRIARGIGIVALLALMAWLLLAQPPTPREAPTGPSEPRVEVAPAGEIVRIEPPLRTTALPILPPGEGALLRVNARDPYGVLDTPHRIWVRQGMRNAEPDWIREGEVLATRLEVGSPPPEGLILFFDYPDRPLARANCTPSTPDSMEAYEAELDLESGVAAVSVTVRGASLLPSGTWTAAIRPRIWRTSLEFRAREDVPCTIIAPADGHLDFSFDSPAGATHRSSLPLRAGRIAHCIELPDGALVVRLDSSLRDGDNVVRIEPEPLDGGPWRQTEVQLGADGVTRVALLRPGRHLVSVIRPATIREDTGSKILEARTLVIGSGETELTITPGTARLLVQGVAPSCELRLYRADWLHTPFREWATKEGEISTEVLGLSAGAWILRCAQEDSIATLHLELHEGATTEVNVSEWTPAATVGVRVIHNLPDGSVAIRFMDDDGLGFSGDLWTRLTLPVGMLQVFAFHENGLQAEAHTLVPEASDAFVPIEVRLEFR